MPPEVRLYVRTALVFFALSMALGAGLVAWRHLGGLPTPWPWVVVHTHLALVGGMLLMVMGVAFWMFPLDRARYPLTRGRYEPLLVNLIYGCVAGGLALRAVVEPLADARGGGAAGLLLVLAALLQALGMVLFLFAIWPRVRAVGGPPG